MIKITQSSDNNQLGVGIGHIVADHTIEKIIGEVLESIEILGLPGKQEQALKHTIKKKIWGNMLDSHTTDSELTTTIILLLDEYRRKQETIEPGTEKYTISLEGKEWDGELGQLARSQG